MDQITQLVYLVKMDNNDMINVELKKITRKDDISYSTQSSGDTYQPNNAIFWTVFHKLAIRGPTWTYASRFEHTCER